MLGKKWKTISLLLFVFVCLLAFDLTTAARPLSDDEKVRLYSTTTGWKNEVSYKSIDVSFKLKIVMHHEAVRKRRQAWDELVKELSKGGGPSRIESTGIASPDGSDTRLIEKRIRTANLLNMRIDSILFANKEKTETKSELTSVNTGPGKDSLCYQINHKSKQVSIFDYRQWPGRKVLRFGKVDFPIILMDIRRLCNSESYAKSSKNKDFSYKGTGNVDGHVVEEIECIDPNGIVKYSISLDTQDWRICRKIVWHDNISGLVFKIVEYKQFAKAGGSGELFPHLVTRRYFDKEGKEKKVETINITNVAIGLPIPEEVFKLNVPTGYTIIDNRVKE